MGNIPNDIWNFFQENWKDLGYTPIIMFRLLERGWEPQELQNALVILIGKDFCEIKTTEWINRLEALGVEFPDDAVSIVEILDRLIFAAIQSIPKQ